MPIPSLFRCSICDSAYRVVKVEAPPAFDGQLACVSCGGPLQPREGGYALKYFRIERGSDRKQVNG
jgi:hypothetical protein